MTLTEYTLSTSTHYARLCAGCASRSGEHSGVDEWRTVEALNVEATVFRISGRQGVVCFRGTDPFSWRDWLRNLQCSTDKHGYHCGFKAELDLIESAVVGAMVEMGIDTVDLAGHSKGGALAVLGADSWRARGLGIRGCYTYGAARALSRAKAAMFRARAGWRTWQWENNSDLVPRWGIVRLGHGGQRLAFDRRGRLFDGHKHVDHFLGRLPCPFGDGIRDHSMQIYLKRLQALQLERAEKDENR